ncbi:uncharacterized protein LOC122511599 isoform X2 [Leptopilina heterotoma]|nr:uncharacterized protein LOC122511599 isoform X2 [Leptopilina heterotoma]XP_043482892.1 uncharacterized protein LOC122511599 isoform X2 [Leptopilina heterotoma]
MKKIFLTLCVTILMANIVNAENDDSEEFLSQEDIIESDGLQEILNLEANAFLGYPKMLISRDVYLDVYNNIELDEESGKCIRPLRSCGKNNERECCRNLRCGRIIKRCLPAWLVPKPPETTPETNY